MVPANLDAAMCGRIHAADLHVRPVEAPASPPGIVLSLPLFIPLLLASCGTPRQPDPKKLSHSRLARLHILQQC